MRWQSALATDTHRIVIMMSGKLAQAMLADSRRHSQSPRWQSLLLVACFELEDAAQLEHGWQL